MSATIEALQYGCLSFQAILVIGQLPHARPKLGNGPVRLSRNFFRIRRLYPEAVPEDAHTCCVYTESVCACMCICTYV